MKPLVLHLWLLFTLCSASVWAGEAGTSCRTPLGVPCHTIHSRIENWVFFRTGIFSIDHYTQEHVEAVRQDGSGAHQITSENGTLFGQAVRHEYAGFYLAAQDRIYSLSPGQQTYSSRSPQIWHDRPYRRSKNGDATCSTGILHNGTDFHQAGTETMLGLTVVHWRRSLGYGGREDLYLAPDLDCAVLKYKAVHHTSLHVPKFILSGEATRIDWGEPSPQLFTIPVGYREVANPAPVMRLKVSGQSATTASQEKQP